MQNNGTSSSNSSPNTNDIVPQSFHIGAIFVVLVASFLGVVAPCFLIKRNLLTLQDKKFVIGKAFSAGIILGVGFIHMMPDAEDSLSASMPDYAFSGLFAAMSAVLSLLIEQIAFQQIKKLMEHHQHVQNKDIKTEMVHLHVEDKGPSKNELGSATVQNGNEGKKPNEINKLEIGNGNGNENGNGKECIDCDNPVYVSDHDYIRKKSHEHEGHTHGVMALYTDEELFKRVNSFTIAHVLEIGIAFHSIIIGIDLSVVTHRTQFDALLIAICFHQMFEGIALGASIQGAKITSLMHVGIMTLIFTLSTPIGQSIGLGIASLYEEDSQTALITEGVFDSISAGILIYMALVDLIGDDFKKNHEGWMRYWMVLAVFIGVSFMAIIGIWA